jgi:hypothetical protein
MALHGTGKCSEIRRWQHYSNQNEMYWESIRKRSQWY